MYNKRFDKSLHDKYDALGKKLAVDIMKDITKAVLVSENTAETTGNFSLGFWDQLYRTPGGKEVRVEPEIKNSTWFGQHYASKTGFPFKYEDMDIPYRKEKCIADVHMVISSNSDFAFLVTRKAMDLHLEESGGKPKFKTTKYEPDGAYYFSTPLEKGYFVHKVDKHWKKWKNIIQ